MAVPGEVCIGRVDVDVPAGRKRLVVSADASTADGLRDRDSLKLTCAPAPSLTPSHSRLRMTTHAFAPRPTVCASAVRAPGT
jgi:hypothetical protein